MRVEAGARPGRTQAASSADLRFVLVFDVVRLSAPVPWLSGRASASHAEGRWFDPSRDHQHQCMLAGSDASLDTTRDRTFDPFMRPIYGQVADWPHGGRSLATSRRTTALGASSSERLSGDGYSGSLANRIATGENASIGQLFGQIEGPALSVACPPAKVVAGEIYLGWKSLRESSATAILSSSSSKRSA